MNGGTGQGGWTRNGRMAAGLALTLAGTLLGGCSQGTKSKYNLALEENKELRRRVATLQSAKDATDAQNAELVAAMEEMRNALSTGGGGSPSGGDLLGGTLPDGVSVGSRDGDLVIEVAGDVLFDSGQATLKSSAKRTLDTIASAIRARYGSNVIRVEGYTDSDPIRKSGWKSNEHLSAERAITVEQYLVQRGFAGEQIYSAAFGPANQRASKKDSRRVEIVVLGSAAY